MARNEPEFYSGSIYLMSEPFDTIKERVDLVELVGRSVTLKRTGSNWKGLCPFHEEKTPSFYVHTASKRYRCFGCNRAGDCFDWLIEHGQVSFRDALLVLATLAGIKLEDDKTRERERRTLEVLHKAQIFYESCLRGDDPSNGRSLPYLHSRGINSETIKRFGLGYASRNFTLRARLLREGFSDKEIYDAGLSGKDPLGMSDFLFDRIVFPIRDQSGHTIAFGGRTLSKTSKVKYINTRDTPLFHKNSVLYGLDQAKASIEKTRQAVIVEGYMDVLQAHQAGYTNVVATLGTSVTDKHLRQLGKIADEIVLALDPDRAGQSATWRSIQMAESSLRDGATPVVRPGHARYTLEQGHSASVRVLVLPPDFDPDDMIRTYPENWPKLVDNALPVIEFVLEQVKRRYDLKTADGRAYAAQDVLPVLSTINSPIEQEYYVDKTADMFGVESLVIRKMLQRSPVQRVDFSLEGHDKKPDEWEIYGLVLLSLGLALVPSGRSRYEDLSKWYFRNPESRALAQFLLTKDSIPNELWSLMNCIRSRMQFLLDTDDDKPLLPEIARVQRVLHRRSLFAQRSDILSVLNDTDDATERDRLLQQYNDVMHAIIESDKLTDATAASGSTLTNAPARPV